MNTLYFIIPTINGEINDEPYVFANKEIVDYIKNTKEVTIYKISLETLEVEEVED